MRKNRLYTVNRWNQPAFMNKENLFPDGGWTALAQKELGDDYLRMLSTGVDPTKAYMDSKNLLGISKANNPFSKGNLKQAFSGEGAGSAMIGGAVNAVSGAIGSAIGGNRKSGVGSVFKAANSLTNFMPEGPWKWGLSAATNIFGGIGDNLFEVGVDQKRLNQANQDIATLNTYEYKNDLDKISGPVATASTSGIYDYGAWHTDHSEQEELDRRMKEARLFANRSITNNVNNLTADQNSNLLRNISAFGGALGLMQQNEYFNTIDRRTDAIAGKNNTAYTGGAKTFADGGLKAAFLDSFGSDPIGAAVRYNQGLEALAAQEEAKQIEAQKAAEYADMQKRLLSLETQNQGLQAMIDAMPTTSALPEVTETPSTSSSTSRAAYNSNWDYIEDQLRRSGKFNDVQIEGIKYNLQRESAINPDAVGDNGSAFGLAQWHGSRKPKDMSIEGQTRHLIETLSNYDGKDHWIGKDNYEGFMNARTPEEAHYYITRGYERPAAFILNKVKRDSDMSLRNLNAFGGELGTNGTDFTNGLLYIDEGGSHESNPLDGVPMGLDPQGIPNLVEEGETVYNDYVFSDRMKVPFFMYKELGLGGVMKKKGKEMSFADASKKLAQESEKRPNDPISQDGLETSLAKLAEVQEAERMRKQAKEYQGLEGYACGGKMGNKYSGTDSNNPYGSLLERIKFDPEKAAKELEEVMGKREATPAITDAIRQGAAMQGYNPDMSLSDVLPQYTQQHREDEYDPYPTWMRYAPAVGAGVMTLTDALGLTNRPDYSGAASIEAAARAAGYAPNVTYDPIGDYMRYTPLDRQFHTNQLLASSRATDRALANNTSPSKAAAMLANGYNTTLSLGNLARQAEEYNRAMYERTKEFNRRTNMFNSQMGLEAAMANARYHQAAQKMGLSGLAQAAALRNDIDARVGAARSANLSNFLTSLGNIGRENFAMNQINSDKSRNYRTDKKGVSSYKRTGK